MNSAALKRKMIAILLIKLVALIGIYWLFFGPTHRVSIDPAQIQLRFYLGESEHSSGD